MSDWHIPKPPEGKLLELIDRWTTDPKEGKVFNAKGREIGNIHPSGYVYISAGKPMRLVKRANVIWYKYHNLWPQLALDHSDRNKQNDRINNLIPLGHRDNISNIDKASGLPTGVYRFNVSLTKPFYSKIWVKGESIWLGCYETIEETSNVYQSAKAKYSVTD